MNWLLDLSRIRGGVDRIERRGDPAAFSQPGDGFRVAAPVVFEADVRKDGGKVRVSGRVATTLELRCGRCLEPFEMPLDAAFDLLFLPATDDAAGGEHEMQADDAGVSFYENDAIDLTEVVREQFFLALPMKPLCREDCRGLCPVCGINRNVDTCTCRTEWIDPRMDVLRSLKKDN